MEIKRYVINPLSKRKIVVGGTLYNRLISDGILGSNRNTVIATGSTRETLNAIKDGINTNILPVNSKLVISRGKLKTIRCQLPRKKLVKRYSEAYLKEFIQQKQLCASDLPNDLKEKVLNRIIDCKMINSQFTVAEEIDKVLIEFAKVKLAKQPKNRSRFKLQTVEESESDIDSDSSNSELSD